MSEVRTFVAIPLPDELKDAVADARDAFVGGDRAWRDQKWVSPENLHITLKFVGNVEASALDDLADAVASAVAAHAPFELPSSELRAVPSPRRATMLWLAFGDPDGACGLLAADIERATLAFGAKPDERAFSPHATLVRARSPRQVDTGALADAQAALSLAETTVSVDSVTLFSSELTRHGPVYTEVRACPLRIG